MKINWNFTRRKGRTFASLVITALVLFLNACGERSTRAEDGQGAGSQADQGGNAGQSPYTGAGHSDTGGADTLGNNPPTANVEENPSTDPGNRAQQGDTVTTYRGAGKDSAAGVQKANERQQNLGTQKRNQPSQNQPKPHQ